MTAFGSYSDYEETFTEILETVLASPYQAKLETTADYVCHTSSTPLSTVVDSGFINQLYNDHSVEFPHKTHGEGGCASPRCITRSKNGTRHPDNVRKNCPCLKLAPDATRVCFLEVMTQIDHKIDGTNTGFDLSKVMFCTNHENIFASAYTAPARAATGLSGFENARTREDLATILDLTYWSRVNSCGDRFFQFTRHYPGVGVATWKRRLKQILFTIDAIIVQLLILCPFQLKYTDLATATKRMFFALLKDYSQPPFVQDGVPTNRPEGTFYQDLVNFTKFCKWSIQHDRDLWLEFPAQTETFKKTVGHFITEYHTAIREAVLAAKDDWTSVKQVLKKLVISQKRGYGHLPQQISAVKRHQFREAISRQPVKWNREKQTEIMKACLIEFTEELPKCHKIFIRADEEEKRELLKEALSHVTLELKATASVDHKISEGGKLEDARELVELARKGKWRIPIRSLETGERIPGADVLAPTDIDLEQLPNFLFWTSVQIVINWIVLMKIDPKNPQKWDYVPLLDEHGKQLYYNPFRARVLHVAEAAKERNLIKCSGIYNWVLLVGGKLMQNLMAESPSHRNGLQGSSADWSHFKRVQGTREGSFLYRANGMLQPDTVNFYTDLTESTDWLVKELGLCILTSFQIHTGFYPWYMTLLKIVYTEPVKITQTRCIDLEDEFVISEEEYFMTEGTPMGMQLAKTLLHGAHFCAMGLARQALRAKGKELKISAPTGP